MSPAGAGHYLILQNLVDEAEKHGKSLGVAVLSYGGTLAILPVTWSLISEFQASLPNPGIPHNCDRQRKAFAI